jgi:uncharacterized protein YggU (UPF0235/DUF167 family)
VAAPPERGRANDALVELLSSALGLPKGSVRVVGGQRGRAKVIEIDGLAAADVESRLERTIGS